MAVTAAEMRPPTAPPNGAPPAAPPRSAHPRRGRFWRVVLWILAIIVTIALLAGGLGIWTVTRAFPQANGTLQVPGVTNSVSVQRDARGIPTITASSSADLFFAQGFVHAQDRFWEMDFRRHLTSARLSELFGESQLGTDTFLRTLGWHRTAETEVQQLPAETREFYESYAAGVNAYLNERAGGGLSLEYSVLGLQNPGYSPEPWTPADSVAWFKAMAWDLRTNIEDETARALQAQGLSATQLGELYPGYPFEEHPVILADDPAGTAVTDGTLAAPFPTPAAAAGGGSSAAPGSLAGSGSAPDPGSEAAAGAVTRSADLGSAAGTAHTAALPKLAALGTLLDRVDTLIAGQGEGVGSNSWVVSGEHTETGKPLLANDPHLSAALPSVWTQMQLRCETVSPACPFDVAGYSFSGLPGIVIGHNEKVAWGFTNLTTDVADLYVERIEDDGYWIDGEKQPFVTRSETINVAGGDPVKIEVKSTGHGPILSGLESDFTAIAENPRLGAPTTPNTANSNSTLDPADDAALPPGEFALSLRWTALDVSRTAEAIFTLNRAENFADFRLAASQFDVPAQNLIYADPDGNIGYQAPGKLPIRGAGDGWLPQPGWDSAYDWQGFIPFTDQPMTYNPESGIIVTANNAIVTDDYQYFLSRDWDYGYRAARIQELLDERIAAGPITALDMAEIQMDNQFPVAATLQRAYEGLTVENQDVAESLKLLSGWDGQNDPDSPAAAFANVLWQHITAQLVDEQAVRIPRDDQSRFARAFELLIDQPDSEWFRSTLNGLATTKDEFLILAAEQAQTELSELQGADPSKWNWGTLHAITLTNGTFGTSGIAPIEALFNRGPFSVGGGSGVVNATGWGLDEGYATTTVPSMRMVIDVSDWDASTWQNLTGASGHAFHPNYTDQTEGWAHGEQYAWAFSPGAVAAAATDELILTPASS
ncbi:penicillin amidase [Leucobacter luti]|uniref:penicillin acylase family protein n=1 Tax=Leucobacter luti TaxID=340320 RepID=UPI0010D763F0|nr:penicillin acylase family protein [Leucobacter luti]MCW2287472.1 penicillin amidase [Leucobacter luti]TCK41694.1 penicillin amidase [Leucobacter luti]